MVFVHSFQPEPMLQQKFRNLEKGLKITLIDHAYSVECVHKFGHTIELYTDILGAEILKSIPYDKVHIVENDITQNYHFAASIKFKALQSMSLDQILIDGDIFLEKSIVYDIINNASNDVVVSLYEPKGRIFKPETIADLITACASAQQPGYELPKAEDIQGWYNTSLLKFNNEDIKQEYVRQYINHVKQADNLDFSNVIWPDIAFEQLNIEKLLENTKGTLAMINPYYNIDDEYAYKIGFCHLGLAKENSHNFYIRRLQTLNYQLTLDLEEHYLYLINDFIPGLLDIANNNNNLND